MGEDSYGIEMTETEIAEFLTSQGHGVLSFGGETPYGIPLSFGYDVLENRCIFQLISGPDSRKQASLAETKAVNLVTYEWSDVDNWRSVVLDGELSPIEAETPEAIDAAEIFAEHGSVVGVEVFDRPLERMDAEWYELRIETMQGYKSPTSAGSHPQQRD
jgi:nitroimidazol reductase NimA-like FMN-containing flavoprotein (pyridoxamine 5'-phosphate oxidase superfamily)